MDVSGILKDRFDLSRRSAGSECLRSAVFKLPTVGRLASSYTCMGGSRSKAAYLATEWSYSNVGGKLRQSAALSGSRRIRVAISEPAAPIC
jgi:hypothetical protein